MISTYYEHPNLNDKDFIKKNHIITSIRVDEDAGHDRITLWNRGGCAGTLTVDKGDGHTITRRLVPEARMIVG
jgi:hypothetical protein